MEMFDQELRVLVATDVLSEGQNLQDAHIVVNYDLPMGDHSPDSARWPCRSYWPACRADPVLHLLAG